MKKLIYISVIIIGAFPVCSQDMDGMWKMQAALETKAVYVPQVQNFPADMAIQQRQTIADGDGDIILGIWRQDSDISQNPSLTNGTLVFSGHQTAYIESVYPAVTSMRKIEFDFNPAAIDADVNLIDIPYSIQIRLEPGVNNTARVRFYVYNDLSPSVLKNAKTVYMVQKNKWNHIECNVENGIISISLNGFTSPTDGTALLEGNIREPVYPNIFIGSRWDGLARWYQGGIDNIKIIRHTGSDCGDGGHFATDTNSDCYVDCADFAEFSQTLSNCTEPSDENCARAWKSLSGDDAINARRQRLQASAVGLIGSVANRSPEPPNTETLKNIFGAYSSTLLRLGLCPKECNQTLRYICSNIEKPRGRLNYAVEEENFTGMELARVYVTLKISKLLEDSTRKAIENVFTTYDLAPGTNTRSENHYLVFWASRYLMAQEMPNHFFAAYNKTGSQLYSEDGERLKQFIRYRAKRGWGEFDSNDYQYLSMNVMLMLYDLSTDEQMKTLSGMMVNLMLADMAVDTINGLYGGARGRVYYESILNSASAGGTPPMHNMNQIQYLYFGIADPDSSIPLERLVQLKDLNFWDRSNQSLFSSFKPMKIVNDIMLSRTQQYVNRERKHLHNMADPLPENPLEGSIRKYTWYVPGKYSLGSIQYQDKYPAQLPEGVYAKHQQLEWIFTAAAGTQAKIFTHHPGDTGAHTYWIGDLGCCCINTFQNKTAVLTVFDINQSQPFQYIHAYFPRAAFHQVVEEAGWIFARVNDIYAALYLCGGYSWTTEGQWKNVEIISEGAKKASVFEAAAAADFATFEAFRNEIKSNAVSFDPAALTLTYNSKKAGKIKINAAGLRQVNDVNVDLNYKTYDSPYMQSDWDSGIITLKHGQNETVLDFNL